MEMRKYRIRFDVKVPDHIPEKEVEEWARFMVGDTGSMSSKELEDRSFDPIYGSFKIEAMQ